MIEGNAGPTKSAGSGRSRAGSAGTRGRAARRRGQPGRLDNGAPLGHHRARFFSFSWTSVISASRSSDLSAPWSSRVLRPFRADAPLALVLVVMLLLGAYLRVRHFDGPQSLRW